MSTPSTTGATGPFWFKAVSIKTFNAAQPEVMEKHINDLLAEGWAFVHCVPYNDFGQTVAGEPLQRTTAAFQVMMAKYEVAVPRVRGT